MTKTTVPQTKPLRLHGPCQFEADTIPNEEYRQCVSRLILETGELASNPEFIKHTKKIRRFVDLGPTPADRVRISAFYADEMRHGYIFQGLADQLGLDTSSADNYTSIEALNLTDEVRSWTHLAVLNTLLDRAGGFQLLDYAESSYAPLSRTGTFVGRDERGHAAMGLLHLTEICLTAKGRVEADEAVAFWYPAALDMFGTSTGRRQWRYFEFGLKTKSNEELRQEFIAEVDPILESLGLRPPDPSVGRKFL